jgi:hypothetical protein
MYKGDMYPSTGRLVLDAVKCSAGIYRLDICRVGTLVCSFHRFIINRKHRSEIAERVVPNGDWRQSETQMKDDCGLKRAQETLSSLGMLLGL